MEYQRALAVASDAARAAGEILRRDLHAPGGPRGARDKADADTEAEVEIRARLTSAFPDVSYRGEETGRAGNEGTAQVWLVDPNDGTRAYLRGQRGSAVSIALLDSGVPVLGVVFAFAAPDDNGDLFAWAEGCGPITRNGKPLPAPSWPFALGPDVIVLHADTADRAAEANATLTAPARYRAVPSIAYRLALVAAGEAAATISLSGPGAWDYAGGHALLRAVGGELIDQDGTAIRYTLDGESQSTWCFGGAPALVAELQRRGWARVLPRKRQHPEPYDLVWPERGRLVSDAGRLSRAQGCLLGQLSGDALGSLVEFERPSAIRARHPGGVRRLGNGGTWNTIAGQPTDDSELALMLARSIVKIGGYDAEAAAQAYAYWYASGPFDCGTTIRQALASIVPGDAAGGRAASRARESASRESQANGSLMRASPLGIWGHGLEPDRLAAHARKDARLTHAHTICADATAVFVVAVAHAIRTDAPGREVFEFAREWAGRSGVSGEVCDAIERAEQSPPDDFITRQGWVLIALQNAFHQLLHAPSLEHGVVATVMAGGDTDTNAAIAGALLGSVHGRDAVPAQWRDMVLSCRPLAALTGVHRPRPRAFWPVDAMTLAERLLVLGSA